MATRNVKILLVVAAALLLLLTCLVERVASSTTSTMGALTMQDKESFRQVLQSRLQQALSSAGDTERRAHELHLAVASLLKLDALHLISEAQRSQLCAVVGGAQQQQQREFSARALYESVVLAIALPCASADFSGAQQRVAKALADPSTSLQDTYYHVRIVTLLQKQVPTLAKDSNALTAAFERIYAMFDESATGAFCEGGKCGLKESGYALEILSMVRSLVPSDKMLSALVRVSRSTDKLVKRVSTATPLSELSVFARGLNRLAKIVPQNKISRDEITQIAHALLTHRQQNQLEGIYDLVEGLSSLNNIFVPVIVSQLEQTKDAFQVSVSDVFGGPLEKTTVSLSKVYRMRSTDSPIASNIQLSSSGGTTYSWKPTSEIMSQLKSAGIFNFDFNVVPETARPNFPPVTVSRTLVVDTLAQVKSFSFSVTGDRDYIVSYPSKLPQQLVVRQADGKRVSVTVSLVGAPQQVFLRFWNKNSNSDAVVALKALEQEGSYTLEINFEKIAGELFSYQSGDYDLQVIVGDVTLKSPVLWNVGSIALSFNQPKRGDKEEEAELYGVQKEIVHRFNQPDKRAPIALSSGFTIAAIAPLGLLLIGLMVVGFNFGNCPSGPLSFIYGLVFHGLIFSLLAVIFLYWTQLTIFQAFSYLGVLGLAAALVGSKQLNSIADEKK